MTPATAIDIDTPLDGPRRRLAIRDSIIAQMMGIIFPTLMRQAGLASLVLIALAPNRGELVIGLAFLIMQGAMLVRIFVAPLIDGVRAQRFMVRWIGVSAAFSTLLVAGPALGWYGRPDLGVAVFLAALLACFVTMEIGGTAWFPLLHYIVPGAIRGRYFGSMRRAWQLTCLVAVFACAAVLGEDPGYGRFMAVLAPAVLLQAGRVWFYSRLPDPPPANRLPDRPDIGPDPGAAAPEAAAAARRVSRRYEWRDILVPLRDRPFVQFVAFVLMVSIVQYATVPFVVPFLRSSLSFPASTTLYSTGGFGLGSALTLTAWGRLADRRGTRFVFLLGGLAAAGALGLVSVTPAYGTRPLVAAICAVGGMLTAGAGTAGLGIAYTVRLMRMAPQRRMATYLNLSQAGIGLTAGLVTATVGGVLEALPEVVALAGTTVATFRLLFALVGVGLLLSLVRLRSLPRQGEPPIWRRRSGPGGRQPLE